MTNPDPEQIAAGLTEAQRDMAVALCGNAWDGEGRVSSEIAIMNGLGLMHITSLRDKHGTALRYKAKPTPLGLAVRNHLKGSDNGAV